MSSSDPSPERAPAPSGGASTPRSRRSFGSLLLLMLAWLAGLAAAAVVGVVLVAGVALAVAYPQLPEIASLTDYRPKLPLRVFSSDGVLLGEFGEERRNFTPIAQIPQVMKNAVLAAEDARFYEHGGVDYKGVARAAIENLRDARSQGASTITMQVARNFYLSTEKTFTRKIYEILLALKIERQLSKDQILEAYMNQIYLGQRANGFAAASEIYFGKKLADVNIAEAAMLAGLPKAPSAYNPIANPKRATLRQRYIIERMFENGFITEAEHDAALEQKLHYRTPSDVAVHAEYVAEQVRQLVFAQYGEETYTRGLNAWVTIDSAQQMAAYRALRRGLMDYELKRVYRGPEAYIDLPADPALVDARVAEALSDHPDNDDLRSAVVLEAAPRKVVAMLQSGDTITVTGDGLKPVTSGLSDKAGPKTEIRRGAVVRALQDAKGNWALTQLPEVEGALVAVDPRTGALRAMVGGFDFGKNKFNHVTQAWRQPGSSFKPFIYSAALEKGFTPATVVNDAPLFFDASVTGSQPWEPKNYDGKFEGPMTLQTALAKSKNMVSIRILQSIGAPYAQQWATRFGFEPERHPAYLTMALGAGSVTPLQMATAYGVFANGGYRVTPVLVTRITDVKGRVLQETHLKPRDESMRVLDERNAFVMGTLLQNVARAGTAARAQATLKRPDLFGKTGTTNDSMDAWFAGYQPTLVAVVWIGYDTPKKLGDRETGGGRALPVWIEYMQTALRGVPVFEPLAPPGVVQAEGVWMYEENRNGAGVSSVGLGDAVPQAPTSEERKTILDLFNR
ncbi:penicillin-binding protein 1A [Rubrivivax gelatinosus]|uniref:penicillin-binding protein 1A n=1 Tax=Rubrivivax gelatinosus TaxID=28068 RepID=UPI00031DD028|nr:penicillin-binding protein 1A [Rubrivivax gelatinosus]MBG6080764.1 penicillin-binding protein 1A [Rubrivivax gelatinosus]